MILTLQCLLRTGNNEVITFRGYIKGELYLFVKSWKLFYFLVDRKIII